MEKNKRSASWWFGVLFLVMAFIGSLSTFLIQENIVTLDFLPLVAVASFEGAFFFLVLYLALSADRIGFDLNDKTWFARSCADTYILAWNRYQDYERQITKAWLFQSTRFARNIKRKCVEYALNERYDHIYKGCCFCIREKTPENNPPTWRPSVKRTEFLAHSHIGDITDLIPDLAEAFNYSFAAYASDAELIQSAIPDRDDPRVTVMHMPVWNEEDQSWHMQEVKRREPTEWHG